MPFLLEQAPGGEQVLPGFGKLRHADFLEPVRAVDLELPDVAPGNRLPLLVDHDDVLHDLVPAAELLADLAGDVAHVDEDVVEEIGPVESGPGDLGTGLRLRHGGEPRQHAAHAHRLVADLDPGELLVLRRQRLHEEVVERLDEGALPDGGQRLRRRFPRGPGETGCKRRARRGQRDSQELAAGRHGQPPCRRTVTRWVAAMVGRGPEACQARGILCSISLPTVGRIPTFNEEGQ